jgi:hypothetical protein
MMPLTLIKSDCYIAVAFDHFSISLMGKKCANNLHKRDSEAEKCARCMKAKLTDNFIVKREFVIIVDHIFCFCASCFVSCSPMDFCLRLFAAPRDSDVKNL